MAKEILYRGQNIEELKKLDVREIAKYLPARARRTVLRNFDKIERFILRCEKRNMQKKPIRTHLRDIIIVPKLIDMTIYVYNGKEFVKVVIVPEMIGHSLGEFALTRGRVKHGAPGIGATRSSAAMSVK